jgi:hypothetical protein
VSGAKSIIAVTVVLLFGQLHCVADCASDLCPKDRASSESLPPCHRHHDQSQDRNQRSCSVEGVVSSATAPDVQHFDTPVFLVLGLAPAVPAALVPADAAARVFDSSDGSPPGSPGISSLILRI